MQLIVLHSTDNPLNTHTKIQVTSGTLHVGILVPAMWHQLSSAVENTICVVGQ